MSRKNWTQILRPRERMKRPIASLLTGERTERKRTTMISWRLTRKRGMMPGEAMKEWTKIKRNLSN